VNFLVLLPYLALARASGFWRERVKGLLHLDSGETPPLIAPPRGAEVFAK
jgi:hypothetical protein